MMRFTSLICLLAISVLFAGCTTNYAPYGLGGGYKERRIDDDTYIVSFFGNGHTSEQQVWNFWIYRCAELTLEQGYEFFELEPSDEHAYLVPPGHGVPVTFHMLDSDDRDVHSPELMPVQYYHYSVTTYSSKAIVNMYRNPVPEEVAGYMDAQTIREMLEPYVTTKARDAIPDRKNLFLRAVVEAAIRSGRVDASEAEAMSDLPKTL